MAADESHDDKTQSFIALTSGTSVLHYKILEKIGSGGMGEVYLALDTNLNRKVALKFLPTHLCQDEDCRKRFKREAQAAAKLSHPNIIHVYEVSEHQGRPFFAMEHIEGRSLRDVKSEELDIDRIIGIAIQLCDGLNTAHAAGVTHRDIKPSNIIIDSSGRPKLLDFGLATVKGGEHLTKTGSTLGTVGYMSPEQIEGKATDARSDLFSLGVVLYELVASRSPFRRDDETATLKAILQDTPEPLARYKSGVPDDLQRIVSKLLEKDPTLRYQSATGVIPDLKKLSVASSASMATERERDRWNRYVVPSAVVILLAVIAIWYFGYRDQTPTLSITDNKIRLAVLPFKNLGAPEDEYFADGVTEEILSRLAAIRSLGVVSSTSSFTYKNSNKTINQIAEELNVDYILEGNIRWDKSGNVSLVRITPQLIQTDGDVHVWSTSYDEAIISVFAVQSQIAKQIADVLDLRLTSSEELKVRSIPTNSIEAYDYYLKSKNLNYHIISDYDRAFGFLERAIELDSSFALAFAQLSFYLSQKYWNFVTVKTEYVLRARPLAERAIELDSTLAMGYIAMGHYYYWVEYDLDMALVMLQRATALAPSNGQVLRSLSYIMRRTGNWEASFQFQTKAWHLDPRVTDASFPLICQALRKFNEGIEYLDKMLPLQESAVDSFGIAVYRASILGEVAGDVNVCLQNLPKDVEKYFQDAYYYRVYVDCAYWVRDYEEVRRLGGQFLEVAQTGRDSAWAYLDLAMAAEKTESESNSAYLDSASSLFDSMIRNGSRLHIHWEAQVGLARANALKGNLQEAGSLIDSVLTDKPIEKDAFFGADMLRTILPAVIDISDYETALNLIERLLSVPSGMSIMELKSNPDYDLLRDHPRFQALIEKYEKERGI